MTPFALATASLCRGDGTCSSGLTPSRSAWNDKDVVGIVDATGRVVARVGDEIQFSAVSISYQEAMDHSGLREISPACTGGYWVVGDDFAAVPDSRVSLIGA